MKIKMNLETERGREALRLIELIANEENVFENRIALRSLWRYRPADSRTPALDTAKEVIDIDDDDEFDDACDMVVDIISDRKNISDTVEAARVFLS